MEENEVKSLKKQEITTKENQELKKLISYKLGKMPYEIVEGTDYDRIEEITLNSRLINGKPSGISIEDAKCFKNLKKLKLSNFKITNEALDILRSLECLESLEIFGAEFGEDLNFEGFEKLKSLRFTNCLEIGFNYPKVGDVYLDKTDIDFSKIDFSKTKSITILNGKIKNPCDLTDFPEIISVNLDGSILDFGEGEKQESKEIKVGPNTRYSHKDKEELLNDIR